MMINADEYFHIGKQHVSDGKLCQDHAITIVEKDSAYFSLSDGCSQGGRTDIGARIINLTTMRALKKIIAEADEETETEDIIDQVRYSRLKQIKKAQLVLDLKNEDLFATGIYGYVGKETAFVHITGDGVVAQASIDGTIEIRKYAWADNTPYYPAYDISLQMQFISSHSSKAIVNRLVEERWRIDPDGRKSFVDTIAYSLEQGMRGILIDLSALKKSGRLLHVALFSDGIELVDAVPWIDAVSSCLAYKTTKGEFVKRRMMRFVKDASKLGKGPLDDISCATIHISMEIVGGEGDDENIEQD